MPIYYIIILFIGLVDTSSKVYDVHTLGIINFGLLSHALADENVQVNGIQVIFDGTGFGIKHQNFYSIEHSINFLKLMHVSMLCVEQYWYVSKA